MTVQLHSGKTPGVPHTYFNDGGGVGGWGLTEVHILYPKKSQLQNLSTQKIPTFFSIPKKILQYFCISKFYYSSSGKLKHANFNFELDARRVPVITFQIDYNLRNIP